MRPACPARLTNGRSAFSLAASSGVSGLSKIRRRQGSPACLFSRHLAAVGRGDVVWARLDGVRKRPAGVNVPRLPDQRNRQHHALARVASGCLRQRRRSEKCGLRRPGSGATSAAGSSQADAPIRAQPVGEAAERAFAHRSGTPRQPRCTGPCRLRLPARVLLRDHLLLGEPTARNVNRVFASAMNRPLPRAARLDPPAGPSGARDAESRRRETFAADGRRTASDPPTTATCSPGLITPANSAAARSLPGTTAA